MFDKRIKQLKEKISKEKLDAVFISSVSAIEYLSGFSNFSKDEREAFIFVGSDFEYIITDGRYSEAVLKSVPHLKLFERGGKSKTEDLLKKHKNEIKILGIEEDNLTVSEYKFIKKHFRNIKDFKIGNLRSVKEEKEIEKIKKACEIGDMAFKYILTKITHPSFGGKTGVTEKEIAQDLEKFIKEKKAEFSFPAIVAFGENSSVPHHQTGSTKLENNQIVLIDMGVKFEGYCSDMTRTIFFGKPTTKQREIYDVVLKAQQKAVEFLNNKLKLNKKVTGAEVDKIARDYIVSKGYPEIPHSLGHGIGLEVHEHPYISAKSKEELKQGMVFSIEPGIYIPNFGGVRIEDLFVIEKNGLVQITNAPKDLLFV